MFGLTDYYREKQPVGAVAEGVARSRGAVVGGRRTGSHLRRAKGLGRFSGTMVSRELNLHCGHILSSLHFIVFWVVIGSISMAPLSPAICRAIATPAAATPKTHRFLHDPSFIVPVLQPNGTATSHTVN